MHENARDSIIRIGETVSRPSGKHSHIVQALLAHIREQGFTKAPAPLGFRDSDNESLSFIEGEVGHYPWSDDVGSDDALISSAIMLREYHDATVSFDGFYSDEWAFSTEYVAEVVCHNDFAPYNCVFSGRQAIGVIDFDLACPAPRAWDLAYALYRFAPLTEVDIREDKASFERQVYRVVLFLRSYGATFAQACYSVDLILPRLYKLVDHMLSEAAMGNMVVRQHISRGDILAYDRDIYYIRSIIEYLHEALIDCWYSK